MSINFVTDITAKLYSFMYKTSYALSHAVELVLYNRTRHKHVSSNDLCFSSSGIVLAVRCEIINLTILFSGHDQLLKFFFSTEYLLLEISWIEMIRALTVSLLIRSFFFSQKMSTLLTTSEHLLSICPSKPPSKGFKHLAIRNSWLADVGWIA